MFDHSEEMGIQSSAQFQFNTFWLEFQKSLLSFSKMVTKACWNVDCKGSRGSSRCAAPVCVTPAVIPGLHWKEISAVTFDMGRRLCLCRMPSAQISRADSSSPWLTECPGNTGLLTNSSFLKASHIRSLLLRAPTYPFLAPAHALVHS